MALTEAEYELLTYIEMQFSLTGYLPSMDLCIDITGCSKAFYEKCFKKPDFIKALLNRGVSLPAIEGKESKGIITPQQMMVVNTLLDRNDTRSEKKKLADLGVPSQTYQGWCKDPSFHQYVSARCEALFPGMLNEAHRALYDTVARGDISAIKLVYEMTGRYTDKKASDVNIEFLLMKILETIQKHVTEPATLQAIADDLALFSSASPALEAAPILAPSVPVRALVGAGPGPSTSDSSAFL